VIATIAAAEIMLIATPIQDERERYREYSSRALVPAGRNKIRSSEPRNTAPSWERQYGK
jgi:hypothetical protein